MKKLILFAFLFSACTQQPTTDMQVALKTKPKTPYCHWELLSKRGIKNYLTPSEYTHVLHLTSDYQTNGTAAIVVANVIHSAEICNGSLDTNYAAYPYVIYRTLSA